MPDPTMGQSGDSLVVKTLWGWRKSEDSPELMEAWDEWSVDGYREGWQEACEKAIKSWGDDLYAHRYIDLRVSVDQITRYFLPAREDVAVAPPLPSVGAEGQDRGQA